LNTSDKIEDTKEKTRSYQSKHRQ